MPTLQQNGEQDSFNQLIIDYPKLYNNANFTFCVPASWKKVIRHLSAQIDEVLKRQPKSSIEISDVKEKYGQLRFYYSLVGPAAGYYELEQQMDGFIDQAENHIRTLSRFEHRRQGVQPDEN